ncbi:MAG TPA: hypothetical protein VMY59_06010 [Candidatus Thermoplasmatota archaeon]|nr:hypothetical protein [Candidatus Thermoplasmatota archaeon]
MIEKESFTCANKINHEDKKKVQGKGFEPQFTGTTMIDSQSKSVIYWIIGRFC